MRQPWNDPLPDGIKPTVSINPTVRYLSPSLAVLHRPAPPATVPLLDAMKVLTEFCDQHHANWTLAKRGEGAAAHMVCQILTQDNRLMSSAHMFDLPRAIVQAVAAAEVWLEQRAAAVA